MRGAVKSVSLGWLWIPEGNARRRCGKVSGHQRTAARVSAKKRNGFVPPGGGNEVQGSLPPRPGEERPTRSAAGEEPGPSVTIPRSDSWLPDRARIAS